jgi:hypothetical protein
MYHKKVKVHCHRKQLFSGFGSKITLWKIFIKIKHIKGTIIRMLRAVITQLVQHWATGWTIGVQGFDSWRGLGIFLFTTMSRTALRPTQPPIQWVPGALSLGVKWLGHEADHSPPSGAEVRNAWSSTSTPPIRLNGMVLS